MRVVIHRQIKEKQARSDRYGPTTLASISSLCLVHKFKFNSEFTAGKPIPVFIYIYIYTGCPAKIIFRVLSKTYTSIYTGCPLNIIRVHSR